MRTISVGGLALLLLGACRLTSGASRETPLLEDEGEVLVYLQPLPAEADRLDFTVASMAALAVDGSARTLQIVHGDVTSSPYPRQRLLARGRLPPGTYTGFLVKVGRATIGRGGESSDLLVGEGPERIAGSFSIVEGQPLVLWATLQPRESLGSRYRFSPVLAIGAPPPAIPDLVGFCTNTASNDVTVFDRVRQQVVAAVATGRAPRGVALDVLSSRAFVATVGGEDIQVIELPQNRIVDRIRLEPGDDPRDVALTPDGRVLVSANYGSSTVSFVDPQSWMERSRVRIADFPFEIVVDRSGKRAFVLHSGVSTITVLDLDYGSVVGTIVTEAEPVAAAVSRDGAVLFVAQRGSPYVSAISVPTFTALRRIYVGPGAIGVIVDPRTDRLYVGVSGQRGLQVFEPAGFTPVGYLSLPGAVSDMLILNAEHLMLALMPFEQAVAAVDLTSGRVVSVFDVGGAPDELAASGERR